MKKKTYKFAMFACCAMFLLFLTTNTNADVAQGRAFLFNNNGNPSYSDIISANNEFKGAVSANPTDQEANLFYSVTRLLASALESGSGSGLETLRDLFEAIGITRNTNTRISEGLPFDPPSKTPEGNYNIPETIPGDEELQAFLAGPFADLLDATIANLSVIDNSIHITLTSPETGFEAVEIDFGDVLIYKTSLYAIKSIVLVLNAYNLNVDIYELVNKMNDGYLQIQRDLLDKYQDLLKLRPSGTVAAALADSREALLSCIEAYGNSLDYIKKESDAQGDDLFYFDSAEDEADAEALLTELTELKDSFNENRVADLDPSTDFNCIFGNTGKDPLDIREVLPEFDQYNEIVMCTFPGPPVLNGIFPSFQTNDDIRKELDLDNPPCNKADIDGDVAPFGNRDGIVNVGDALVTLRFALSLENPTAEDIAHGDVAPLDASGQPNPDGVINVGDALVILRKALGIISF